MSKRVKINFNTVNGDNWEKLDIGDFGARIKLQEKIEYEARMKKEQEEKERIDSIKCPACKSTNKHHHKKYQNNGILGPGSTSWITEEYLVCLDCGIHFSDLKKK